jgi:hypothetical protein
MNFGKPRPAAVAVPAQSPTRSLRRDAADVLLVILIDAALVGIYLLRGAARVRLRYQRFSDSRRRASAPD